MIKSHNPHDQEIDFFVSFLSSAIKGNGEYIKLVSPIITDAVRLAKHERTVYEVDRMGLDIKLLLWQNAAKVLQDIKADDITSDDLSRILNAINEYRHHAIA